MSGPLAQKINNFWFKQPATFPIWGVIGGAVACVGYFAYRNFAYHNDVIVYRNDSKHLFNRSETPKLVVVDHSKNIHPVARADTETL